MLLSTSRQMRKISPVKTQTVAVGPFLEAGYLPFALRGEIGAR